MLVKVTQEHIDKGRQNCASAFFKSRCCPIALALKDTFKVNYTRATLNKLLVGQFPDDNIIFDLETPSEVSNWIESFDNDEPVQPFEFELSLEGVKL